MSHRFPNTASNDSVGGVAVGERRVHELHALWGVPESQVCPPTKPEMLAGPAWLALNTFKELAKEAVKKIVGQKRKAPA